MPKGSETGVAMLPRSGKEQEHGVEGEEDLENVLEGATACLNSDQRGFSALPWTTQRSVREIRLLQHNTAGGRH